LEVKRVLAWLFLSFFFGNFYLPFPANIFLLEG
jgi:hypothetical protein